MQKRFAGVLGRDAQLLSITFDPERDTPEVLAAYARQWSADPRGWRFLTGSVDEVRRVCGLFGVDALPTQGLLSHMVRTAIVGPDGRFWPISKEISSRRNNLVIYCAQRWSRSHGRETH